MNTIARRKNNTLAEKLLSDKVFNEREKKRLPHKNAFATTIYKQEKLPRVFLL